MRPEACLWALLATALSLGAVASTQPSGQVISIHGVASTSDAAARTNDERRHRFNRLVAGGYGGPEDFSAWAQLAFKLERRAMVESRALTLASSAEGARAGGWREERGSFWWRGVAEPQVSPLKIPLAVAPGDMPFRLGDFDEIWLDYSSVPGVTVCTPRLELGLASQPIGQSSKASSEFRALTAAPSDFKILSRLDVTNAQWRAKGYGYLLRRELGLAPDEEWRYARDGSNAVLQRRLKQALDNVEALDIVVARGIEVVHVNMRIHSKHGGRRAEVIEFAVPPGTPRPPQGGVGVRIHLRDALAARFPRELANRAAGRADADLELQEISIFVPGDPSNLARSGPIRSLEFAGFDEGAAISPAAATRTEILRSNVTKIGGTRLRMAADLRPLAQRGEVNLTRALVELRSPVGATSCAIRVEGVHVANAYLGSAPGFANRVESWSRRWGDTFTLFAPQADAVENPGFIGHLFFAAFPVPDGPQGEAAEYTIKLGPGEQSRLERVAKQRHALPYRVFGPDRKEVFGDGSRLVTSRDASLAFEGVSPRFTREGNMLVVEGGSTGLNVSWPLAGRIGGDTWFVLSVPEGAEQIDAVSLALDLSNGRTIERKVVPNRMQRLGVSQSELRNVRLVIRPSVIPFRFKLAEMAFLEPKVATYAEALRVPLPTPYVVRPTPVLASDAAPVLETARGRLAGLGTGIDLREPLRFSTVLEPGLETVLGLQLRYRFPPRFLDDEACPLRLQFNWSNGRTGRHLCFDKPRGDLFIPIANLLGASARSRDRGALLSIDWTLEPPAGDGAEEFESFELGFAVEGWTLSSAADELRLLPMFTTGTAEAFAEAGRLELAAAKPFPRKIWMPVDAQTVSRMFAAGGAVAPVDNHLFTLEQVVLEPVKPLSEAQWRELDNVPSAAPPPRRWPKWPLGAVAVLAVLLVLWKRGWSPERVGSLGIAGARIASRRLHDAGRAVHRLTWRTLPIVNIGIGAFALVFGVWMAGRLAGTFAGWMVLASAAVVVWAAYLHWRGGSASFHARVAVLAIAIGCAMWALGRYKASVEALWGFLPLAGVAFVFLPELYRFGRDVMKRRRGYLSLATWLALCLGLYGLGTRATAGAEENYFFTFGALAGAFALRSGLWVLEPPVRRHFPKLGRSVYAGSGGVYFAAALILLAPIAAALIVKRQVAAEQLAVAVYFCLAIGVVKEAWARRRGAAQDGEAKGMRDEPSAR